jgi:hypothetical protein
MRQKTDRQPILTALLRALEGAFRPGEDRARQACLQRTMMETYARALDRWGEEFAAVAMPPRSAFADFWGPERIYFREGAAIPAVIRHVARGPCKGLPPGARGFLFFMLGIYEARPRAERRRPPLQRSKRRPVSRSVDAALRTVRSA